MVQGFGRYSLILLDRGVIISHSRERTSVTAPCQGTVQPSFGFGLCDLAIHTGYVLDSLRQVADAGVQRGAAESVAAGCGLSER